MMTRIKIFDPATKGCAQYVHVDNNDNGRLDKGDDVFAISRQDDGKLSMARVRDGGFKYLSTFFSSVGKRYEVTSQKFDSEEAVRAFGDLAAVYEPAYIFSQLNHDDDIELLMQMAAIKGVRNDVYELFVKMLGDRGTTIDSFLSHLSIIDVTYSDDRNDLHSKTIDICYFIRFMEDVTGAKKIDELLESSVSAISEDMKDVDTNKIIHGMSILGIVLQGKDIIVLERKNIQACASLEDIVPKPDMFAGTGTSEKLIYSVSVGMANNFRNSVSDMLSADGASLFVDNYGNLSEPHGNGQDINPDTKEVGGIRIGEKYNFFGSPFTVEGFQRGDDGKIEVLGRCYSDAKQIKISLTALNHNFFMAGVGIGFGGKDWYSDSNAL